MKRNGQEETVNGQKQMTKYDRKMEARKIQEKKDKRNDKIFKIGVIAVCACLIIAIASSIIISVTRKSNALNKTYVTVGNHELTEVEYDYYFKSVVNNYANTYSSIMGLIGLDLSGDLDAQAYSDTMSWKDMFDQMAISQIRETKALVDEAGAKGFEYDSTEEYQVILDNIASEITNNEITENDYYQSSFGTYATKENMEPVFNEGLLAAAYYNHLIEQNAPAQEEIDAFYAENKRDWDETDYRLFTLDANAEEEDPTEDQMAQALADAKKTADEFAEKRKAGDDFETLCIEYASEGDRESYENEETEYSLKVEAYYASISASYADWIYDDARKEGDITVIEDADANKVYVVEFVNKYYDKTDDANIANNIAYEAARAYIEKLTEGYVFDGKGNVTLIEEVEEE